MKHICHTLSQQTAIAGWAYYVLSLFFLPGLLLDLAARLHVGDAVVNFVYYLLNFFFAFSIFRGFLVDSLAEAGNHLVRFLLAVSLGFVLNQVLTGLLGQLVVRFAPGFSNVNDQAVASMFAQSPTLICIGTVLLVPLAEECLYRGLIFGQIYPKNRLLAFAVSACAFSAVHVMGYAGSYPAATLALCFAQYLPAGLILAGAYGFCGSIWAPILIHTATNAVAVLSLS